MQGLVSTRVISIIIVFIILLILIFKNVVAMQYKLIYEPSRSFNWEPNSEIYETHIINIDGYNIHSWFFKRKDYENKITIFFCHGSKGNISQYKNIVEVCDYIDVNLVLFDYRGYGKSSGYVTQKNILKDGEVVYDYYSEIINSTKTIIMGESLGGAVATYLASIKECKGLVLVSTFDSLSGIVLNMNKNSWVNKFLSYIVSIVYENLESWRAIQDVHVPILMFHSSEDRLININSSKNLYSNISHNDKEFVKIKGTHIKPIFSNEDVIKFFKFIGVDYSGLSDLDIHKITDLLKNDHDI